MPNTRLMLWFAFAAILYLNYEAWMRDYQPPASPLRRDACPRRGAARRSLWRDTLPTASYAAHGNAGTRAPARRPLCQPPLRPPPAGRAESAGRPVARRADCTW